LININMK